MTAVDARAKAEELARLLSPCLAESIENDVELTPDAIPVLARALLLAQAEAMEGMESIVHMRSVDLQLDCHHKAAALRRAAEEIK